MSPNILLWDVETSHAKVATFSLYEDQIPHQNILQDWYIICAAWKKLNASKINSVSVLDDQKRFKKNVADDYHVIATLRDVLEDVDIIIGHNQKKFDLKKFQARLIYHKLKPLPKLIHAVDTLTEVRKIAAFSSNRLDYLGNHLCGQGKMGVSSGLWLRALQGDIDSIKEMVKYNKVDVKRLEELYLRLAPYIKNHPHIGVLSGLERNSSCPNCGSKNLEAHKTRYSASGVKRIQVQCGKCHSYSTHLLKAA